MSASISQAKNGGSGVTSTSPVGFNLITTAGSLLVCIVWSSCRKIGSGFTLSTQTPVTSGITWVLAESSQWGDVSGDVPPYTYTAGEVDIFYAQPAVSIPTSATTTVSLVTTGAPIAGVEFALMELGGLSGEINAHAYAVGSGVVPSTPALTLTKPCFVLAVTEESSSNSTAGTGFTIGLKALVVNQGTAQYILNAPAGTRATSFGGSIQTDSATVAVAFSVAAATGSGHSRAFIIGA